MVSKTAPETQPEMKQRSNPARPTQVQNPAQTAAPQNRTAQTTPATVSQPMASAFPSTKVRAKPGVVPGTGVFSTN
jgi:hypothetical protein